jgi:hypothetical protein
MKTIQSKKEKKKLKFRCLDCNSKLKKDKKESGTYIYYYWYKKCKLLFSYHLITGKLYEAVFNLERLKAKYRIN